MMGVIEIQDYSQINGASGTTSLACQNSLQDMIRVVAASIPLHSVEVFRITSPGIIAILIGLLLPAVQKSREAASQSTTAKALTALNKLREAAGHSVEMSVKPQDSESDTGDILPYIERLHRYLALGAKVELRVVGVAVGDVNGDTLTQLAKAFGVPVLIGAVGPNVAGWQGPVTKATPAGTIEKV